MGAGPGLADGQSGESAGPVVDARGARGVQSGFLNTQINYYSSYYYGDQTWAGRPAAPPLTGSPYRGLSAFEAEDEQVFFGRDEAIAQVTGRLSRALDGPGLMIVSGVSGAGKSSLLRAGVLPRLRRGGLPEASGSAAWPCLLLTPGHAPRDELAVRVASLAETDAGLVRRALTADPAGFALTARQAALARHDSPFRSGAGRLLLVIDQFEQLFTLCPDERQRRAFITALHAAASVRHGRQQAPAALVVLGLRADFEARCADYPELAGPVQDRYLLTAMTARQLRIAITAPATRAGSSVDPELTELLLRELGPRPPAPGAAGPGVTGGAGALPLLSHALDQAWRNRAGTALTLSDYERTGGIESAVARSADQVYRALTPARQVAARQVFTRLTATGADGTDTAAPAAAADLTAGSSAAQASDVVAVVNAFAAERLLTLAPGTVEITHEVLLTAWPLLRDDWLAESRGERIVRTRLATSAAEWRDHARDSAYLYSGTVLDAARAVAARGAADPARHPPLNRNEQAFLAASGRVRRRRARLRRGLIAVLAALTLALAAATVLARQQRDTAVSERDQAVAGALAAQSQVTGDTDPVAARLEAVAAWHLDPTDDAGYAMLAAGARPLDAVFNGPSTGAPVAAVAFSPDGQTLAVVRHDGTGLWDMATRQPIPVDPGGGVSAAFSPGGKVLAIGTQDQGVELWDVPGRHVIGSLRAKSGDFDPNVVFSPNGALLAVGGQDEPLQVWDVTARRLITTLPAMDSPVAFSPDSATLAVGDGTSIQLWDASSWRLGATVMIARSGVIASVAFSPGGATLAVTTTLGGPVRLLDVASRRVAAVLPAAAGSITATAQFSPDGDLLAVNSRSAPFDGISLGPSTTQLWNAHDGQLLATLPEASGLWVGAMAFSPDGSVLATGTTLGSAQLWDIAAAVPSATVDPGDRSVSTMAFSPDGTTLAVAGSGGTQLWDASGGKPIKKLPDAAVDSLAFSPDGKVLAVGAAGGTQLWDMPAGKLIKTLPAAAGSVVRALAFSPGGTLLAAALDTTAGGTVQLWDIPGGHLSKTLTSPDFLLGSLAFSPGGSFLAASGEVQSGTAGGATLLWQLPAGQLVGKLELSGQVTVSAAAGVAFSPDGTILAVGTGNGTQLWTWKGVPHQEAQLARILPTGPWTTPLAFAPGSDALAVSTLSGIQLWDAATGQQFASRPVGGASQSPQAVAVSAAGTLATLAVDRQGQQVQLWRMPYLTHPAAALCALAGVPFDTTTWAAEAQGILYQPTCP